MSARSAPVIAVLNSNQDLMNGLREVFEDEGWLVITERVQDIKQGKLDLIGFLRHYDPDVILYDVAPPYEENWNFMRLLRDTDAARHRKFVLTTTNRELLEKVIGGPSSIHEIIGKPFDLEEIVSEVRRVLEDEPVSHPDGNA